MHRYSSDNILKIIYRNKIRQMLKKQLKHCNGFTTTSLETAVLDEQENKFR